MGTSSQGFDLMDDDMEDETSNELETIEECDDSSGNKQMVEFSGELAGKEKPQEPYVGLEFKSADDAREHYSEYARLNGFTVRVNRKRRSRIDRAVIGFDYVCSKEGFRRKKGSMEEKILRLSKQTRVGCKAILVIAYRRDIEKWVVTNFIKEHNHELMVPSEVPVRQVDKGPLNEDDKDKKIRELTTKLYNEKQRFHRQCAAYEERCAEYKAQLGKILKDIELHTEHLTNKVQDVVQSIKEIEDEEDSDQDHYQPPAILMYVDSFVGNDAEMIENTTGRDLRDSQIIETAIIDRVPARGGEDSGEMTENSNEMGLNSSYADEDLDPHEGMEFESEETAKAFYDAYAMHVGFVTRMSSYCRSKIDGAVISRRLVCNKEGFKKGEIKRPMAVTREGCKAMINIKRQKPGKWIISKFQKEHDHPLLLSSKIQRGSLQNRSMEDARKIRELSYALQRANRRCTVYREQLDMVLKDIEKHTDHLSVKVQEIVNSITEIESEEDHSHHDRQLCYHLSNVCTFLAPFPY